MTIKTCENESCSKTFNAKPSDLNRGWARFCSKKCAAESRKDKPTEKPATKESNYEIALMFMHAMLSDPNNYQVGFDVMAVNAFDAAESFIEESRKRGGYE